MTYDASRQQTVLFGGKDEKGTSHALDDTWVWDGTNWVKKQPLVTPPARWGASMIYDALHNNVILFGGADSNSNLLRDTWIWNGYNWSEVTPAISPTARLAAAMIYDRTRQQVVLFGGFDGALRDDTWTWDGIDWTQKDPVTRPQGRYHHAMTYDAAHQQAVLFGGMVDMGNNTFMYQNDTWVWDGINWAQKSPASAPSARVAHSMVFDTQSQQVVLFGGDDTGSKYYGDTWMWDGSNWIEKYPISTPPGRSAHGMTYDEARQQVVLFGGWNQDTLLFNGLHGEAPPAHG